MRIRACKIADHDGDAKAIPKIPFSALSRTCWWLIATAFILDHAYHLATSLAVHVSTQDKPLSI